MYVILDTNVIIKDYYFKTPKFEALWDYLAKTPHSLLIPQIVIDELKKNHSEEVQNAIMSFDKTVENANRALAINVDLPDIDLELEKKGYEEFIANLVDRKRIKILPLNDSHLSRIAKRAVARTAPFLKGDKDHGFKDALIWESVVDCLNDPSYEGGVAFITKNVNQFSALESGQKDLLNQDLSKEIANSTCKLEYFTSLEAFLEKYPRNLGVVSIKSLQTALDGEVERLVRSGRLSENELSRLFRGAFIYPTESIGVLETPIKRFYVYRADETNFHIQARGLLKVWVTLWNPLVNEELDDEEDTVFEATFTLNRMTGAVQIIGFEPQEIEEPSW